MDVDDGDEDDDVTDRAPTTYYSPPPSPKPPAPNQAKPSHFKSGLPITQGLPGTLV